MMVGVKIICIRKIIIQFENLILHLPANKLGDARRNKCASSTFEELDEEERNKDIILAKCLLKHYKSTL